MIKIEILEVWQTLGRSIVLEVIRTNTDIYTQHIVARWIQQNRPDLQLVSESIDHGYKWRMSIDGSLCGKLKM